MEDVFHSKMPGVSARSASKNMSRSKRSSLNKNERRSTAAIYQLDDDYAKYASYGKIAKALGNKMFKVITADKVEHIAHIRGRMVRIAVDDVVLLNKRDYESRSSSNDAVYDIIAAFSKPQISTLVRSNLIPLWMRLAHDADPSNEDDVFELHDEGAHDTNGSDEEDVDVDNI